jgi:6-phosphofructokinase 2
LILTVTINPAIDRTLRVDRLVFDDRAYILDSNYSIGGRGINSSKVVHTLGGETKAILPLGGGSAKVVEESLSNLGFPYQTVKVKRGIRTNFTITQDKGLTMKLNELGPQISKKEVYALIDVVRENLPHAKWLMLCGSVPPSVPNDFYATLIADAKKSKVPVMLDGDNEAMLAGVKAGPTVACPNQMEAERLLNNVMVTRTHFIDGIRKLHDFGARDVLLKLGSRGALALIDGQMYEAIPPRIDAVCAIGAGDAFVAAYCWAQTEGLSYAESLRWAVAAGSASAKLPGVNFATREQTEAILKEVVVNPIPA